MNDSLHQPIHKILIIDSSSDDRVTYQRVFDQGPDRRYITLEAEGLADGLAVLREHQPDCVLLECCLPDDSLASLRTLIAEGGADSLGIVVLAKTNDVQMAVAAMKAGAHDYLEKSHLTAAALLRAVNQAIERVAHHRQPGRQRDQLGAEEKLRESEERYRSIVNQTVGGIAEVDLTGKFTTVNQRFCEITGYSRHQLLGGMRMQDITHAEDLHAHLEKFQRLITDGTAFEIEKRYVCQDGSVVWVNNSVSAIRNAVGQLSSIAAVVIDITERKYIEQALRESENQMRIITNAMPALISYIDADCRYRFVNQTYTDWFGHTSAEVIGKTMQEVLGEAAFAVLRFHVAAALAGTNETFEAETPYKDGGTRFIQATYTPDITADGTVKGFFVLVLDITERKRAVEAQSYLAAIIESSDDAVISKNLHGIITSWNHSAEKLFGYTAEEIIGKSVLVLLPPHLAEEETHILATVRRGQAIVRHETVRVRKDGTKIDISLTVSPIRNPAGEIIGASKIARDITEHKRHERSIAFLAEISQEALNLVNEREIMQMVGAKLGAFLQLSHCVFVEVNEAADEVTGLYDWHRADVPSAGGIHRVSDYVSPEVLASIRAGELVIVRDTATDPRVNAAANAALKVGSYLSIPLIRNGEWHFALAVYHSEAYDWRTDEIALLRELTTRIWTRIERARGEEALRAEEERYRVLFNSIDEGFCLIEMIFDAENKPLDYRLVQANPAFTRLTGFPSTVLGKTARQLVPDLAEFWFTTYGQVALTGEAVRFENYAVPLRRWFDIYASRVGDATSCRVAVVFNDITERKQTETERERLLQKEKQLRETAEMHNRTKDEFLAVVSHELRNPLNSILGYTRLTRINPCDTAQVVQYCEIIERNARMQQQLIEDLLDTARIISGKLRIDPAPLDFRLVIEDALAVVRTAVEAKQINLHAHLGVEPQPLLGDAARLQQVVCNLLQNAIKFTPDGGRVEVQLERSTTQLQLRVSDTGHGIEAEFLPAIFDRFSQSDMSRTRRHGGLGLGLALAKQLIELHGGTIEAVSAGIGQGATFTVILPLQTWQDRSFTLSHDSTIIQRESEVLPLVELPRLDGVRVLVVDDQEEARQLATTVLIECGAEVTVAASGQEAEMWMTQQFFNVLVCDISMPEMDGYTLLQRQRARERRQNIPLAEQLPAVALTAHARSEDRLRALSAGFQMHIAKPIELAELVLVVAHLLSSRPVTAQS